MLEILEEVSKKARGKMRPVTPRQVKSDPKLGEGSSSRPKVFLLDKPPNRNMGSAKLPKGEAVFLALIQNILDDDERSSNPNKKTLATAASVRTASKIVCEDILNIWRLHFGGDNCVLINDSQKRMIIGPKKIQDKLFQIYQTWKSLEQESRTNRKETQRYLQKVQEFQALMKKPFDITNQTWREKIASSGIKDFEEDIVHVQNQMLVEQVGTIGALDRKQDKSDARKRKDKENLEAARQKSLKLQADVVTGPDEDDLSGSDEEDFEDFNSNDPEFVLEERLAGPGNAPRKIPHKKLNIMGPIANSCLGRKVSVRQQTVVAAKALVAAGIDLNDTNVSVSSAQYHRAKARKETAAKRRSEFRASLHEHQSLHVDGKMLTQKGTRIATNRIAVVLRCIDENPRDHIIGVPYSLSGTGEAEGNVVKEVLEKEGIRDEIKTVVFDTTSSNTSDKVGLIKHVEEFVGHPILFIGCRHHCAELNIGSMWELLFGKTVGPRVAIFVKFQKDFEQIPIDMENLQVMDQSELPQWMKEECKKVLAWAEEEVKQKQPRGDYKELLELLIVYLGGSVHNFR